MKESFLTNVIVWTIIWTIETLIIKLALGVSSWWIAFLLAVTLGSMVVWFIKNVNVSDLFD